jgi:hypothetical protein
MNTIQITNDEGQTINYTETEITTIIKNGVDNARQAVEYSKEISNLRREVRDFFSEGEWSGGEQTVNKGDVNFLLERIGANKLTTKYNGTFTITGTFSVEVEDEDEIETIISENTDISNWSADMDIDVIEVDDIEEED